LFGQGPVPGSTERPGLHYERLARTGFNIVAGVDEAGRGPLAGPVVAAAVILPPDPDPEWFDELRDSKQLSSSRRRRIYDQLLASRAALATAEVSVRVIERSNIALASRLAMVRALRKLPVRPDLVLVDGREGLRLTVAQWPLVKGDALSASIAAASIAAKVVRDEIMDVLHQRHPAYGFDRNRGYGTPEHLAALERLGPCDAHRRTFGPVRAMIERRAEQKDLFDRER